MPTETQGTGDNFIKKLLFKISGLEIKWREARSNQTKPYQTKLNVLMETVVAFVSVRNYFLNILRFFSSTSKY